MEKIQRIFGDIYMEERPHMGCVSYPIKFRYTVRRGLGAINRVHNKSRWPSQAERLENLGEGQQTTRTNRKGGCGRFLAFPPLPTQGGNEL